eukprot:TRINITY_DN17183_c0_g1_i1.p1 TRINITY_DN17183_c0_g1~~TRINITY_DN17183_c0_g1_i1.p1  ORF type:complete len:410 (+),score=55.79 TRINITY_DN17183_c0_g1_i1:77-1306(+)
MSLMQGLLNAGARAAAAGLGTVAALGALTGESPADELAVARSPGFRGTVLALQKQTAALAPPPLDGLFCQRLQLGSAAPHLDALEIAPPGADDKRIVLFFHGGAHCLCSASTHADMVGRLSQATKSRFISLNYRMAPEHPFPAGLEDALTALRWVRQRYPRATVAVAGDSAGGNLAFALLVKLAQLGETQPAACIGLSPWLLLDLHKVHEIREERDALNNQWGGDVIAGMTKLLDTRGNISIEAASKEFTAGKMHDVLAAQYFQDHPASDPLVSPMLAPADIVKKFPPVLIHADADEPLSADARHMAASCKQAGVDVQLELYPGTTHVFQMKPSKYGPATEDSFIRISAFLDKVWQTGQPAANAVVPQTEAELMKLPVKELKALMVQRQLSMTGCVEKKDFVDSLLGKS